MIRSRRKKPRPGRLQGVELADLRLSCWLRDDGVCKKCSCQAFPDLPHTSPNSYHMSHIKAKRIGLDVLENVETLCGDCHRKFHNFGPSMKKPVPPKDKS